MQGDVDIFNQIQKLEKWLQDWKADYTSYGNDAPDVDNLKGIAALLSIQQAL